MAPHTPIEFPKPWIDQVPEDLPRERRSTLAMLAAIDDGVGRVRQQIDKWDGSLNLPMRGQKGMVSEGGIRVPFVATWPAKIPSGQVFDHSFISLDIAATAIAAVGQPPAPELDGVNLLPALKGDPLADPSLPDRNKSCRAHTESRI